MTAYSLVEIIMAFHLSYYVDSPISDRLGLMLVAPPGTLKSTLIKMCLEGIFSDALVLGDVNAQTLDRLQPAFANERYHTLALPDFEKVYERAQSTASNCEGIIKAMMAQGYSEASFDDHRMLGVTRAQIAIIGGIVPAIEKRKIADWIDNGFARRFLWCHFQFHNPRVLIEAIHDWKAIAFDNLVSTAMPLNKKLKMEITPQESNRLELLVREQYDVGMALLILKRIFMVLRWKFRKAGEEKRPMEIVTDFAQSLKKERAKLTL